MSGELFSKWLAHYDSIHRGYTPRGMANAVCATNGWTFPRINGGYNLYRGTPAAPDIDYAFPVGAAGPAAETVTNFAWRPHAADTEYFYVLRAVGGGGVESPSSAPPVSVVFDAAGGFLGGRPNSPMALTVTLASGGRFVPRWSYSDVGEEASPTQFRVYTDGGTGTIDYDHAVGQIAFRTGQVHFSHTSDAHVHGARRRWGVRAVTDAGRHDGNEIRVQEVADAEGPEPHPNVVGEVIEQD